MEPLLDLLKKQDGATLWRQSLVATAAFAYLRVRRRHLQLFQPREIPPTALQWTGKKLDATVKSTECIFLWQVDVF